jgi:hypothetical protein
MQGIVTGRIGNGYAVLIEAPFTDATQKLKLEMRCLFFEKHEVGATQEIRDDVQQGGS